MARIRFRRCLLTASLAACVALGSAIASACTVPVFRYALERWESDRFLVVVYHSGGLTAAEDLAVSELAQQSSIAGGPLNIEVLRYDVTTPPEATGFSVQPPSAGQPLPWLQIHGSAKGRQTVVRWQGSLADAVERPGVFDSPARGQIARRLLEGDSAVWLLVAPEEQLPALSEQLQAKLNDAAPTLTLPQGIGLPGSELYAKIPLEIRFSVVAVAHSDRQEETFLSMIGSSAEAWRTDTAYVIPIFGRCRALDVFPYAEANEALIEDVGNFLCAACSCRVKQANPGFDLLTSVAWSDRLFGEAIPQDLREASAGSTAIAAAETNRLGSTLPEYLAIASGNENEQAVAAETTAIRPDDGEVNPADQSLANRPAASGGPGTLSAAGQRAGWNKGWLLLTVLIFVGGIFGGVRYLNRKPA